MFDKKKVERAAADLMRAMGYELAGDLAETPRRVAGYWEEVLQGERYTNSQIAEMCGKTFLSFINNV